MNASTLGESKSSGLNAFMYFSANFVAFARLVYPSILKVSLSTTAKISTGKGYISVSLTVYLYFFQQRIRL